MQPLPSTGFYNADVSLTTLDSTEWFAASESSLPPPEDKSSQLQRMVERSNTISRTAQARFAVADQSGAEHDETVRIAQLLQTAIDHAPTTSTSSMKMETTTMETIQHEVDQVLSKYSLPHWMPGGTRQLSSVIGKLRQESASVVTNAIT